jgi:hypothetical protein
VAALAPELDHLVALAPESAAALSSALDAARSAVDPQLLAVVERRVEAQLGLGADDGADPADPVIALVDQFVFYVADVDEDMRAPVRERLGADGLAILLDALYVVDQTARLRLAHARLFGDPATPSRAEPEPEPDPTRSLADALSELHASAMRLDDLDPLTTEIVRRRAATWHDCKT